MVATFPALRLRRMRRTEPIRRMVRETALAPGDLVYPMFVVHGRSVRREIDSMPGCFHLSPDEAVREAEEALGLGVPAVLLFGIPAILAIPAGYHTMTTQLRQFMVSEDDMLGVAAAYAMPMLVAAIVLVLGAGLFVARDVRGLVASRIASQGFDLAVAGQRAASLAKYLRAADLMPEAEVYSRSADFLFRLEADARGDPFEKIALKELALELNKRYEERNPFNFSAQNRLARAELELGRLGREERLSEAVNRYIRLADALRSYPRMQTIVAAGLILAGEPELGLLYADRAIALETAANSSADAWLARGAALELLGRTTAAIAAFEEVIVRGADSVSEPEAHFRLATIYT